MYFAYVVFFFCKQKTAYEMRISDWSSDVCSSDLPHLGIGAPTVLKDYPVSMAALSRPKPGDPRVAERFELYVCGLELANAFGDLTDPKVQRGRFQADMDLKERSEEHTSELQSLMRNWYAVFCL